MFSLVDSSSVWVCHFNSHSERFNGLFPKNLEPFGVDRMYWEENFVGQINSYIQLLKLGVKKGKQQEPSKFVIVLHLLLSVLSFGLWLPVFLGWYLWKRMNISRAIQNKTYQIKLLIGRLIQDANRNTFHPKGLDVATVFDIQRRGASGVATFVDSYLLVQVWNPNIDAAVDTSPQTIAPSSSTHHHIDADMDEPSSLEYYHVDDL